MIIICAICGHGEASLTHIHRHLQDIYGEMALEAIDREINPETKISPKIVPADVKPGYIKPAIYRLQSVMGKEWWDRITDHAQ